MPAAPIMLALTNSRHLRLFVFIECSHSWGRRSSPTCIPVIRRVPVATCLKPIQAYLAIHLTKPFSLPPLDRPSDCVTATLEVRQRPADGRGKPPAIDV